MNVGDTIITTCQFCGLARTAKIVGESITGGALLDKPNCPRCSLPATSVKGIK